MNRRYKIRHSSLKVVTCRNVFISSMNHSLYSSFILCCVFIQEIEYLLGTHEFSGRWCSGNGIPGKNINRTHPIPTVQLSTHFYSIENDIIVWLQILSNRSTCLLAKAFAFIVIRSYNL